MQVVMRYAIATTAVALSLFMQWELERLLAGRFPFITQYGAVAVTVWLCGWRPAALAALAGFLLVGIFFVKPQVNLPNQPGLASVAILAYLGSCGLIIWMGESMRRQRRAAEERGERLEMELARRKAAEEALRQRHEELDVMVDAMPAFVWTTDDPSCARLSGNRAVRELFEPSGPADVRGTRLEDDAPPAEYFDVAGRVLPWEELPMQRAAASGKTVRDVQMQIRLRGGRKLWVMGNAAPVFNRDGKVRGVIASFVDYTTQKQAEEARERARQEAADRAAEFQALIDAAPVAVWIAHDANCRRITGNAFADEVVMRSPRGANASIFAGDSGVAFRVTRGGVTLSPEELPTQRVCATGKAVLNDELQFVLPDGRSVFLLVNAKPLFDAAGQVRGAIAAAADVTKLKEAERELREAHRLLGDRARQLEQIVADRTTKLREMVEELEAFAYQLVHNLRAPLESIQNFSHSLARNITEPASADYIRKIAVSAEKMDRFVHDVWNYSQLLQTTIEMEPVDLRAVLHACISSSTSFQPPAAQIEVTGDSAIVQGNKAALIECVTQILGNAVKFVAPGVTPSVRIWCDTRAGLTTLYFEDNGIGIPKTAQQRIFDVFQRVDKNYDGSGIGLTIVKKAVERMGGKIGLQSEPGQGSLFFIELKSALATTSPN